MKTPVANVDSRKYSILNEALQILDQRKQHESDGERLRTYVLAELHPKEIGIARKSSEDRKSYKPGHFRLSVGDRTGDRKSFKEADRIMISPTNEAELIRLYLMRMERDPPWPAWIP